MRCAIALCVIAAMAVLAVAAPNPPAWPPQFSTGFELQLRKLHHNVVGRLFFDEKLHAERVDTAGAWGWDVRVVDYSQGKEWNVVHVGEKEYHCTVQDVSGHQMPVPNFKDYTFVGQDTVNNFECDHWQLKSTERTVDYWDVSSTTDPMQMEEQSSTTDAKTLFFDFDRGAQYAEMFNVSYEFPGITCHPHDDSPVPELVEEVLFNQAVARRSLRRTLFGKACPHAEKHFARGRFQARIERMLTAAANRTMAPRTVIDGKASWFCCNSRGQSGCGCTTTAAGACGACGAGDRICATRFGPCGMKCTVTNKNNGRSVTVTRGDYGPAAWTGRDIDMNCGAAQALDMISAGVVPAHISCDG